MNVSDSQSFEQKVLSQLDDLQGLKIEVLERFEKIDNRLESIESRDRWNKQAWRVIAFAGSTSITLSISAALGILF
ncbi:MAG: hypothetical protein ACFCU8_19140 [Thermosynechococcaceae cyanobacterium]